MKRKLNVLLTVVLLAVLALSCTAPGAAEEKVHKDNPPEWLRGKVWYGIMEITDPDGHKGPLPNSNKMDIPANAEMKDVIVGLSPDAEMTALATSNSYAIKATDTKMMPAGPAGQTMSMTIVINITVKKIDSENILVDGTMDTSMPGMTVTSKLTGRYTTKKPEASINKPMTLPDNEFFPKNVVVNKSLPAPSPDQQTPEYIKSVFRKGTFAYPEDVLYAKLTEGELDNLAIACCALMPDTRIEVDTEKCIFKLTLKNIGVIIQLGDGTWYADFTAQGGTSYRRSSNNIADYLKYEGKTAVAASSELVRMGKYDIQYSEFYPYAVESEVAAIRKHFTAQGWTPVEQGSMYYEKLDKDGKKISNDKLFINENRNTDNVVYAIMHVFVDIAPDDYSFLGWYVNFYQQFKDCKTNYSKMTPEQLKKFNEDIKTVPEMKYSKAVINTGTKTFEFLMTLPNGTVIGKFKQVDGGKFITEDYTK